MKVRTLVGAQYAYACITTDTGTLDVRLNPGRSASQSLRESAAEMRADAERLIRRAEVIEQAAVQLAAEARSQVKPLGELLGEPPSK